MDDVFWPMPDALMLSFFTIIKQEELRIKE